MFSVYFPLIPFLITDILAVDLRRRAMPTSIDDTAEIVNGPDEVVELVRYPISEDMQCSTDPVTYILELKIHAQKAVVEAIQAVQNAKDPEIVFDLAAAAEAYFGHMADEVNRFLDPMKVQIHINLDALIIEDFMTDLAFDKSCELVNAVLSRTVKSAESLRHKYNNTVGLNLYVWACVRDPIEYPDWYIEKNEHCGRVMGQLWLGTVNTLPKLVDLILKSIRRDVDYIADEQAFSSDICNYVGKCIARTFTDLGQKLFEPVHMVNGSEIEHEV